MNTKPKPDSDTEIEQAASLLHFADQRWPGNLWVQLARGSVLPFWIKRLAAQTFFGGGFSGIVRHVVQMSWAESNDDHGPREFHSQLGTINRMVDRIKWAR